MRICHCSQRTSESSERVRKRRQLSEKVTFLFVFRPWQIKSIPNGCKPIVYYSFLTAVESQFDLSIKQQMPSDGFCQHSTFIVSAITLSIHSIFPIFIVSLFLRKNWDTNWVRCLLKVIQIRLKCLAFFTTLKIWTNLDTFTSKRREDVSYNSNNVARKIRKIKLICPLACITNDADYIVKNTYKYSYSI